MPRITTGLIIAGAYANKLRRVMFAANKGKLDAQEIARAVGVLNAALYEAFTKLGVDKGDVVRISVDYDIVDGKIKWNLDTLTVEYFKRGPDITDKVKNIVVEYFQKAGEGAAERVEEKAEKHETGKLEAELLSVSGEGEEEVYSLRRGNENIGAARIKIVDDKADLVALAIVGDKAFLIRGSIDYSDEPEKNAENIAKYVEEALNKGSASEISKEEAKKLLEEILASS